MQGMEGDMQGMQGGTLGMEGTCRGWRGTCRGATRGTATEDSQLTPLPSVCPPQSPSGATRPQLPQNIPEDAEATLVLVGERAAGLRVRGPGCGVRAVGAGSGLRVRGRGGGCGARVHSGSSGRCLLAHSLLFLRLF